jgi:outer membrane protein
MPVPATTSPGRQAAPRRLPITRFKPLAAAAAALLGLIASGAQAQSLQELYEAARAYDASYLASRAAADSVQYRLTQAQALKKPTLGLGSSVTHSQVDPPTVYASTAAGQVKVAGDRVGSTTVQAGLSASYSLYNRASGVTSARPSAPSRWRAPSSRSPSRT